MEASQVLHLLRSDRGFRTIHGNGIAIEQYGSRVTGTEILTDLYIEGKKITLTPQELIDLGKGLIRAGKFQLK